jgi:LuxR family maltose regulon positive regulatory protein
MLLLNTKLNVPPIRSSHVHRVDLIQKLDKLQDYRLALIVASAGYGKTALVSEWIAQSQMKVVWFSIDAGDNDPVRFWDYVIAAIQTAYPEIGEQTLTLLHEPQPLPVETILSTLINELSTLSDLLTVVLDDYHVIESSAIHDGLAFLVEHMPSQIRLIMTTRTDPPLPLARMRVSSQCSNYAAPICVFRRRRSQPFLRMSWD